MSDVDPVTSTTERLALLLPLMDTSAPVAYADPPNSVSPGASPSWVVVPGPGHPDFEWTGRGAYDGLDGGAYLSIRIYKCILIVGTLGSGGPGDTPKLCKPLLDKFTAFFLARPQLSNPGTSLPPLEGVLKTTPGDDTGEAGVELNGQTYVGVIFDLEVQAVVPYTFVSDE